MKLHALLTPLTLLLFFVSAGVLLSCSQDDPEDFVRDTAVEISIVSAAGEDLLDPALPNAIGQAAIKVSYLQQGRPVQVMNSNLDYQNGFLIYRSSHYTLRLFPSEHIDQQGRSTTYLQLKESEPADTLVCQLKQLHHQSASVVVSKIWHNSQLVWDGTGPRYFVLTK
ncbi:hypothetical protein FVR03_18410 [Pontibacter qinzhouensis]|uniref:Uncharacterized protein n=1 Tax=Pontibacter qinzhouensis TaxID=2603253 RepID=A0A5C8J9T1_9BACT|nr:hypothetical protein [Pontibacter qinzhouensis]TXK33816.1 hypothetical protein FVR03_18410 [Pontibacter qinzhouensis]